MSESECVRVCGGVREEMIKQEFTLHTYAVLQQDIRHKIRNNVSPLIPFANSLECTTTPPPPRRCHRLPVRLSEPKVDHKLGLSLLNL